jgi:hypothetical protein
MHKVVPQRALECGSLLPLSFAGSLLPTAARASSSHKSGSKLPHSKALQIAATQAMPICSTVLSRSISCPV